MEISKKKIFLALSPHINYYHSYRGDSKGETGFGKDLAMMRGIIDVLDKIEDMGLGSVRISWDYGDTFWSIQLQKEFQPDVLDRVVERCKKGKDEVLIGSWGNVMQPVMDTEEFLQQHQWFLENSMGIGVNQLFPGRVAPYARTQESMFSQGMIELYNEIGVKGICNYYSVYGFDVARPFLNPRLDWNQRYGLVKFNSTISNASCLMIPTYGFGDVLDFCSIKRWFKILREKQVSGEIKSHALLFLNFDMDYENWLGMKLPNFLSWLPNSRGLIEFAEVVDQLDYVEFTNLLEIVPKLEVHGETTLREDVADGMWNGYYNWSQKFNNTRFWTVGQQARWLKCISDTLTTNKIITNSIPDINRLIRDRSESPETYFKNKILLNSTTNFGMAMPFLHSDRRKTAISYALKAFNSSQKAFEIALKEHSTELNENFKKYENILYILPITNRGVSEKEIIPLSDYIFVQSILPSKISELIKKTHKNVRFLNISSEKALNSFSIYEKHDEDLSNLWLEALIPRSDFSFDNLNSATYALTILEKNQERSKSEGNELIATKNSLRNKALSLEFNEFGKIISFKFNDIEFACPSFLESSITYGKSKNPKSHYSTKDEINVHRKGDDGFSASISIISEFFIEKEHKVQVEKILKLYADLPYLFISVKMKIPDIRGETTNIGKSDGTSYFVEEEYQEKWQEIIPCEVRSNILGLNECLKIWKRNFLGVVDYFNLDMKEVDRKNADIDCLVANVSDGWMALSNGEKGILVGFNSLKASNFAFSPIKLRDKGFGDLAIKGQQVRINPFGTYYGKLLHYWSEGNGHAQKIVSKLIGTNESTAPTFSGKTVSFDLLISPYLANSPPEAVRNFADHYSLGPLVLFKQKNENQIYSNHFHYVKQKEKMIEEFGVEKVMKMTYIEWVRKVNKGYKPSVSKSNGGLPNISILNMIRVLIDGIKGR
ncbi:MAG: hypothetical protein ACFE96_03875 [Candidatus Hermodarchaeota archaeon]